MTRSQSRSLFLAAALLVAPGARASASMGADHASADPGEPRIGRSGDLQAGPEIRAESSPARDRAVQQAQRDPTERMSGSGGGALDLTYGPRSANFTESELEYIQHGP